MLLLLPLLPPAATAGSSNIRGGPFLALGLLSEAAAEPPNLVVNAALPDGTRLHMWVDVVSGQGRAQSGFTPFAIVSDEGAHRVTASNYSGLVFDRWEDGSTGRTRVVDLGSSETSLTAYYKRPAIQLHPAAGMVGSAAAASGANFAPHSQVAIRYAGAQVATVTADASGWFWAPFEVPEWAGAGSHAVEAVGASGWRASATFEARTPPTIRDLLPKTGAYVALYVYPAGSGWSHWQRVIDAKHAHPSVPVVAAINPSSGPGLFKDSNYASGIQKLRDAGIIVLGYTYDGYGQRPLAAVKADTDKYWNWYGIDGLFIDEFTNKPGFEWRYADVTAHAKSIGMKMTMGNPGTDVPQSYLSSVDVLSISEGKGHAPMSWLEHCVLCSPYEGWHHGHDKRNFAYIRYAVGGLDTEYVKESARWVGLVSMTDGVDPVRFNSVPHYFGALMAALDG